MQVKLLLHFHTVCEASLVSDDFFALQLKKYFVLILVHRNLGALFDFIAQCRIPSFVARNRIGGFTDVPSPWLCETHVKQRVTVCCNLSCPKGAE